MVALKLFVSEGRSRTLPRQWKLPWREDACQPQWELPAAALHKEPREGVQPVVTRDDLTEAEGGVRQPPVFAPNLNADSK